MKRMTNKSRRFIASFIFATIIIGVVGFGNFYQDIRNQITEKQKTIDELKKSIDTLQEESKENISKATDHINSVENELKETESEKEKLQKQIDEMMKQVSLDSSNVSLPSGATTYHMKKALKGTTMYHLSNAFVDAEKEYGVNAFFLAGIVALESSWATSSRATDGSNNLTGHAVYSDSSRGSQFSSHYESVMVTARDLKRDYLTEGGQWNNGLSIEGVNIKYSADPNWNVMVEEIAQDLVNKANA